LKKIPDRDKVKNKFQNHEEGTRMKKLLVSLLLIIAFPLCLMAEDFLAQADALYNKKDLDGFKQSIELYLKAFQANPKSYEIAWKTSRAFRDYGDKAKTENIPGWKDICKTTGKSGMEYGLKAQALEPNGVEGWWYYGLSVGTYSDAVSILTALKEGLKNKTQKGFEMAYAKNKMLDDGGPILALGRFWMVLPWPMKDSKKSEQYLREYLKLFPNKAEAQVYLGELLMDDKKDEAKILLEKAAASSEKYWADQAKTFLAKIK
jgi:tetratricopeptide (TPR) repeat protein